LIKPVDTKMQPLSRGLASAVVARLSAAIHSGDLAPGERLNEEALASALGVSRGPIREALTHMERQGLVIIRRNRGAYVARLQRDDVDEVYSLRLALEGFAVQRAVKFIEPEQLAEMQAIVDKMADDPAHPMTEQGAADLDIAFHDLIYQASKHQRLYECWTTLRGQIQIMFLTRNVANPDFREQNPSVHQELLDAIKNRNEDRALALTNENIRRSYEHVMRSYPLEETPHLDDESNIV
jgi:DNA-binding GntR family transcriptional regulator